jgi:formylglycine-generating enzyme required for sulfatase activity
MRATVVGAAFVTSMLGLSVALAPAACSTDPAAEDDPNNPGGGSSGRSPPGQATDGRKNGTETDVDCGGESGNKCGDGKACVAAGDCASGICQNTCQAPSPTDGVKNGDETDVDCGGSSGKPCAAGQGCNTHADCTTDGCDFAKKCAIARSCTAEAGGATCGSGSIDNATKQHESCCKTVEVPRPAGQGGPYFLDKYLVTAGRLRAFVERTGGNPRAFVQSLPEGGFVGWKHAWDERVPSSTAEVNFALASGGNHRGCDIGGGSNARTYWMTDAENDALGEGHHPANGQSVLDAKVLICVETLFLYALCAWDGARLPSVSEVTFAWTAGESRRFPWGADANDANHSSDNEAHDYPPGYAINWVNVPEPGRYPAGYGKWGHADLVGTVFHLTRDITGSNVKVVTSGSWETAHTISVGSADNALDRAYWAYGGRCARESAN